MIAKPIFTLLKKKKNLEMPPVPHNSPPYCLPFWAGREEGEEEDCLDPMRIPSLL